MSDGSSSFIADDDDNSEWSDGSYQPENSLSRSKRQLTRRRKNQRTNTTYSTPRRKSSRKETKTKKQSPKTVTPENDAKSESKRAIRTRSCRRALIQPKRSHSSDSCEDQGPVLSKKQKRVRHNQSLLDSDDEGKSQDTVAKKKEPKNATTRKRLRRFDQKKIEARNELKELEKDQQGFQNDKAVAHKSKKRATIFDDDEDSDDSSQSSDDESSFALPIEPLCDNCAGKVLMQERQTNEGKKVFFSCPECNSFLWARDAYEHQPEGPPCDCGRPSFPQILEKDNINREGEEAYCAVWRCINTDGKKGCDFELPIAETWQGRMEQVNSAPESIPERPTTASDEQYHVGAHTNRLLQGLFHIESNESQWIREGRGGYCDYYQVHRAWRVDVPQAEVEEFRQFRSSQQDCGMRTELRSQHQQSMDALIREDSGNIEALDESANEVLLLHGTKPEVVANILEKSLDPGMANRGLFGRGTYFAEHPCKIDQYTTIDQSWVSPKTNHRLSASHKKLYRHPDWHGGDIFYALVCRVVLGNADCTTDTYRDKPRPGHYSIVAENGNGSSPCFREFIVFDKRAIKIEYIVAYKRVKKYCPCGVPVRERTMPENGKDRKVIACNNSYHDGNRWTGGCGLFAKLPRCYCRYRNDYQSAKADLGTRTYCCGGYGRQCGFREAMDHVHQPYDDDENEDEDEGDNKWYKYDGFVVKG